MSCFALSKSDNAILMIDRDFMRGFVKLYTLWRASKAEVYGLEIMEEMRRLGFNLSPGTLYPALHALLQERDVTVSRRTVKGKIRKCYRATVDRKSTRLNSSHLVISYAVFCLKKK